MKRSAFSLNYAATPKPEVPALTHRALLSRLLPQAETSHAKPRIAEEQPISPLSVGRSIACIKILKRRIQHRLIFEHVENYVLMLKETVMTQTTVILLGTGRAGVGAAVRKRRKSNQSEE